MSLIHAATSFQGTALVSGGNFYPAIAIGLALVHGIRALTVSDARAAHWLSDRGFLPETRDIAFIRGYLLRLRVARFVGALMFLALAVLSLALFQIPIGVLSAPYLLSVLGAELMSPNPRQGRERVATLQRRPADFFAPRRAVTAVRVLLIVGIAVSAGGVLFNQQAIRWVHLALLVLGAAIYESCLRVISRRGLPSAERDVESDTAVRVASSRTATAAALGFAAFGAAFALVLVVHDQPQHWPGRWVVSQALTWGGLGAMATVFSLLQPVRFWRPPAA